MLKVLKVLVLATIFFSILSFTALAQDVEVTKTAPSQINLGENLKVTITVTNKLNQQIIATLRESIGDAQAIEPQLITPRLEPGMIAARPPYFEWSLIIDANSQKEVSYTIRPNKVGYYTFSPSTVITSDGKTFYSNTLSTQVVCNKNGVCEEGYGEDYTNCPEDCHPPSQKATEPNIAGLSPILVFGIIVVIIIVGVVIFIKPRIKIKIKKPKKET